MNGSNSSGVEVFPYGVIHLGVDFGGHSVTKFNLDLVVELLRDSTKFSNVETNDFNTLV